MPARHALVLLAAAALAAPASAAPIRAREIRDVLEARDADAIRELFGRLERELDDDAVRTLVDEAGHAHAAGVYDDLVALLGTAHGDALEELADQYRPRAAPGARFLVLEALGQHTDPLAEETLAEAADRDGSAAVAAYAVRLLGRRGTATAIDALIELLDEKEGDRDDRALVAEINAALGAATEQDYELAADWAHWWEAARGAFARGRRSGAGDEADAGEDGGSTRTRTILDRIRENDPNAYESLQRLDGDEILCVEGTFDQVQDVLSALEVPHQVHPREALDDLELDPSKQILVMNCHGDRLTKQQAARIRAFVGAGGYLFTSDWELGNVLAPCFPDVVRSFGRSAPQRTTPIQPPGGDASHPLLRDVFPLNPFELEEAGMVWQVDGASEFVQPHPAIRVLVEGTKLDDLPSTTVAFTFCLSGDRPVSGDYVPPAPKRRRTGDGGTRERDGDGRRGREGRRLPGRVVHVMSHFSHQAAGAAEGNEFALQQLLFNMVLEKEGTRR